MSSLPSVPRPLAIAPPTSNGNTTPQSEASTMPYTCVTCAKRKVKCDKVGPPCSTCRKGKHECHYEAPAPRKRKRKAVDDVQEKLERYEGLLKQHGLIENPGNSDVPERTESPYANTFNSTNAPASASEQTTVEQRTGKLLAGQGKTRYIDSTLWRNLIEQNLHLSDGEEDEEDDHARQSSAQHIPSPLALDPVSAAVFSPHATTRNLLSLHPTYEAALKLWQAFAAHVEPITKTFHVPTARAMVQRAAANPSSVSRSTECLLFAIYHFAVTTLTEDECVNLGGDSKAVLRSRYHDGTRQALVNAHFLRTTDVAVLQAYVLFLLSVRLIYDPHTFWILTGVATRIAQRIGLHRDGEALGLRPFEAEMRRRLFWQTLPLDGMSAQLAGARVTSPYEEITTQAPLNVNDDDLDPAMTALPPPRKNATDMIFCLARIEMGKFHAREKPFLDWAHLWRDGNMKKIEEVEKGINELESAMEEKFFRYCDFLIPHQFFTMIFARAAVCISRLRLRLPGARTHQLGPEATRAVFEIALKVLDYLSAAWSNPGMDRFFWHMQSYIQWEPFVWILDELRRGSSVIADPANAWAKIENIYAGWPDLVTNKRALHVAIAKLSLTAWDSQPTEWRRSASTAGEPGFIVALRASTTKRQGSRRVGSGPIDQSNPWSMAESSLNDVEVPVVGEGAGRAAEELAMDGWDLSSADAIDWTFWEQLIREPDAFPVS